jgi:ribonuclease J
MNLKIIRSSDQKSTIIEISASKTKILLDGGVNLGENEVFHLPDLQTQYDFSNTSAVFLSHYRADYSTLTHGLLENVPVYTGKLTGRITAAAAKYKAGKPCEFAGFYESGVPITVGEIRVTPYPVDDLIYDGFLLLIETDGKKVLYTGDYRANSRKRFEEVLKGLSEKVDLLICERGVIAKEDVSLVTERDVEEKAAKLIEDKKGPVFILQDLTDFDRAASMYFAAKRSKRVFLEDLYLSQLASAAGDAMPNPAGWTGVRAYLTSGYKEDHFRYKMFTELPRLSKSELVTQKYVMCIRTTMKKFMKSLFQEKGFRNGLLINTLPEGSWNNTETQEFLSFASGKGLEVVTLRSSGHADAMALKALVNTVKPAKIVPVDPEKVPWLAKEYAEIPVLAEDSVKV